MINVTMDIDATPSASDGKHAGPESGDMLETTKRDSGRGMEKQVVATAPSKEIPPVVQQLQISSSSIDGLSKCALLLSGALYAIGLLVTNFSAQRYGRTNLSLVEAQYVLVGLLWLALTLLSFALTRSAFRWIKDNGPWKGRPLRKNLTNALWASLGCIGLLGLYVQVAAFLGVENPYRSWVPWAMLGTLVFTNISLGALFQDTLRDMNQRALPGDKFLAKLWKADSIQISKRILYFFISLSLYAILVYPNLSPAVGGGRLHQAEFIIRQDRRSIFDTIEEFKIDKSGKLGPVAIVSESDQSFVVTAPDRPWWDLSLRRSLEVKKDLIEVVMYTK
jgi:hypothetical protein